MLFARSGSILTLLGGFMTFRSYLRGRDDDYSRDTGRADQLPFRAWDPFTSRAEAERWDVDARKWGLLFIVFGTLIWGYGDLLFPKLR